MEWDKSIADALGIEIEKMPKPRASTEILGGINEAAASTGLKAGMPVVAGGPDDSVGVLGARGIRTGTAVPVMGTSDVFLTSSNLINVTQQININFIVAVEMMFVIISGSIDFSVGSNLGVTALFMAVMMYYWHMHVVPTVIVGIIMGTNVGGIPYGVVFAKIYEARQIYICYWGQ